MQTLPDTTNNDNNRFDIRMLLTRTNGSARKQSDKQRVHQDFVIQNNRNRLPKTIQRQ